MHQLYLKYKDREFIYIIPLVVLCVAWRLRHFFRVLHSQKGFPRSEDSQWYLEYAYSLMANFKIGLHVNDILYFGYNILLTLLLAVFRDPVAVIFLQALVSGLCVIFVYQIARLLFNRTTAVIASYFYADAWHISIWSMHILSESFFISLLLVCVYFLLMSFASDKKIYKILFGVTALYLAVFRPTGIVSVGLMMLYIIIRLPRKTLTDFVKTHRLGIGAFLIAAVAACVYLVAGNNLDPFLTSLRFNVKMLLYNIYAKGWIYDKSTPYNYVYRPDYTKDIGNSLILSFLIHNWDHILMIYGRRVVAFLGWWVWDTDLRSISGIKQFAGNIRPTALFFIGTIAALTNGTYRKASIVWLMILAVFVFCIVLFIDGMYRYKAPSLPFIAIAAAYGADRIIRAIIVIAKKIAGKLLWNKQSY